MILCKGWNYIYFEKSFPQQQIHMVFDLIPAFWMYFNPFRSIAKNEDRRFL
jgi:hypothetical protein